MTRLFLFATAITAAAALTSCQLPSSLVIDEASASAVGVADDSLRVLAVGLEAPTWDSVKEANINAEGPNQIDDTYTSIKTKEKVLAITFDDGPHASNTPRLLDILKERNVRATFYVVGNMVRYRPEMLRRMVAEGHEIGNHTVTHGTLSKMSMDGVRKELQAAHDQIEAATGVPPRTMRPPGGAITKAQKQMVLSEFGYPTVLWSCDPKDWQKPGVSVVTQRLVDGAYPGGILLMHDLHKASIDAVPAALDTLLSRGYRFVTVTELIGMEADF